MWSSNDPNMGNSVLAGVDWDSGLGPWVYLRLQTPQQVLACNIKEKEMENGFGYQLIFIVQFRTSLH